jgi:hypothetical protein
MHDVHFALLCTAAAVSGTAVSPAECQASCEAAGHCSVGLTSCDQQPTCAIGCAIAERMISTHKPSQTPLDDCKAECTLVGGKAPGTGGCVKTFKNLTFALCGACQQWKPSQQPPAGDPNPQDCGTQVDLSTPLIVDPVRLSPYYPTPRSLKKRIWRHYSDHGK